MQKYNIKRSTLKVTVYDSMICPSLPWLLNSLSFFQLFDQYNQYSTITINYET